MKLSSYLDSKLIFVNVEAKTKDEAINTMIDKIAKVDRGFAKHKNTINSWINKPQQRIKEKRNKNFKRNF